MRETVADTYAARSVTALSATSYQWPQEIFNDSIARRAGEGAAKCTTPPPDQRLHSPRLGHRTTSRSVLVVALLLARLVQRFGQHLLFHGVGHHRDVLRGGGHRHYMSIGVAQTQKRPRQLSISPRVGRLQRRRQSLESEGSGVLGRQLSEELRLVPQDLQQFFSVRWPCSFSMAEPVTLSVDHACMEWEAPALARSRSSLS